VHARRGTQFHAWVESHFGSAALLDVDGLPGAGDLDAPADGDLASLRSAFLASPWSGLEPLAIEADIETPVAGATIRCRIDAVFPTAHGVQIVDWKTGRPAQDAADRDARQMQLSLYRLAWSRLHSIPLDSVRAAFYYVAHDLTIEAEPLSEDEIVSAVAASYAAG
jgi:DNA helicase-2/ATP-dependent DNA helicase PcrA